MSVGGQTGTREGAPRQWPIALLGLLLLMAPSRSAGQLSPGKLSSPHAHLEGSGNCLECHQSGKGVAPEACLSCHKALAGRIASGRGLHAGEEYRSCERCHIEHHGPEFELVWWGDRGKEAFDHDETGYALEGAHGKLACEECHTPELIVDPQALLDQRKDLERTLMGLETPCLACHQDEHRGQVAPESCLTCHDFTVWKPAASFDHGRTEFPLTGRHRDLACTKCHATRSDAAAPTRGSYLEFPVAAFRTCTDCHHDLHEGRLGTDCQRCHSTAGWTAYDRGEFDHDRTEFPLAGEHLRVACDSCHARGSAYRVAEFAACADCHGDTHLAQFADPPATAACEPCHTVAGFTPSTFDLDRHQKSGYPLKGSHLATPCNACHRLVGVNELARHTTLAGFSEAELPEAATQFRFASTACLACHRDPHLGEVDRWIEESGCETCHVVETWRQIRFDHDRTEFPLRGAHAGPRCELCHLRIPVDASRTRIGMKGASSACSSCHEDKHFGQFITRDGSTRCQSCHGVVSWEASLFDHNRDSIYALDGAHLRVPCDSCHELETTGGQTFVRYKPLATECEACHGRRPGVEQGSTSGTPR